jgi:hypothetical protein
VCVCVCVRARARFVLCESVKVRVLRLCVCIHYVSVCVYVFIFMCVCVYSLCVSVWGGVSAWPLSANTHGLISEKRETVTLNTHTHLPAPLEAHRDQKQKKKTQKHQSQRDKSIHKVTERQVHTQRPPQIQPFSLSLSLPSISLSHAHMSLPPSLPPPRENIKPAKFPRFPLRAPPRRAHGSVRAAPMRPA